MFGLGLRLRVPGVRLRVWGCGWVQGFEHARLGSPYDRFTNPPNTVQALGKKTSQ